MQTILTHPLLTLNELDETCRDLITSSSNKVTENTPTAKVSNNIYSGISFTLGEDRLLIENIYIDEIIGGNFQQNLSTVPGAKPWLMGLISLRGQPLTIIDLKQYLFDEKSVPQKNSRLIVIKSGPHISGLYIENIEGLKQLNNTDNEISNENMPSHSFSKKTSPFIEKIFNEKNSIFGSLSIPRLINDKDFANAAR